MFFSALLLSLSLSLPDWLKWVRPVDGNLRREAQGARLKALLWVPGPSGEEQGTAPSVDRSMTPSSCARVAAESAQLAPYMF